MNHIKMLNILNIINANRENSIKIAACTSGNHSSSLLIVICQIDNLTHLLIAGALVADARSGTPVAETASDRFPLHASHRVVSQAAQKMTDETNCLPTLLRQHTGLTIFDQSMMEWWWISW